MSWASWLFFVTVSAVNIITPGPANLNTLRRALQLGMFRVWPTIFGNALGLAGAGTACAAGIGAVVLGSDLLWGLCRGVGAGYLAWLGCKLLLVRETLLLHGRDLCHVRGRALFSEAFFLALTNPKALLFYMALFPQILRPETGLLLQSSVLIMTYCALSILSLGTYSALAHVLRRHVVTQAGYDGFRRCSGAVLLGFALWLLLDAT